MHYVTVFDKREERIGLEHRVGLIVLDKWD